MCWHKHSKYYGYSNHPCSNVNDYSVRIVLTESLILIINLHSNCLIVLRTLTEPDKSEVQGDNDATVWRLAW